MQELFCSLKVHGYATHAIFDDYKRMHFMFMDYIIYNGATEVVAEQTMLQDLERLFGRVIHSCINLVSQYPMEYPLNLQKLCHYG